MYLPILRNRTVEFNVIKNLLQTGISDKTIPLFEIIQEKKQKNSSQTYVEDLAEIFNNHHHSFFLDVPKLLPISTTKEVTEFLSSVNRVNDLAYQKQLNCKNIVGMIPVISYKEDDFITDAQLKNDVDNYHSGFSSSPIAIRITPIQYNQISNLNQIPLTADDYLILDIGRSKHSQEKLLPIYRQLKKYKSQNGITTCIINDPRPSELYNSKLVDRLPIKEIDNSLLKQFSSPHGFDGFGDYSGITSALPATRRSHTLVGIYYSAANNYFIGYVGRNADHSEYSKYIAPSILASPYWNEFSSEHHLNCPGCSSIQDIANGGTGKTPTKWKEITMTHYIYTVDQIMQQ